MTRDLSPDVVGGLDDDAWLAVLERSLVHDEVDGVRYPRFPDERTQMNFVGASQRAALEEAIRFVRYATDALAAAGGAPSPKRTVLDFGCGWGRITRTLLRDFRPEHIVGVDPIESMVKACRDWFEPSPVAFETIDNWPPLAQGNDSVDLVVAYSVFSHLPERLATAWIAEFARVLKPGGLVVATTQSRSFIGLCEQTRTNPAYQDSDFLWFGLLARSFVDADDAYRRYDAGEFLHEPNGGGEAGEELAESLYGDSLFSGRYVAERWGHLLELVRFDDKPNALPQAVFVLQKPVSGGAARTTSWSLTNDKIEDLEDELEAIRHSESWRIGQAALAPVRLVRAARARLGRGRS